MRTVTIIIIGLLIAVTFSAHSISDEARIAEGDYEVLIMGSKSHGDADFDERFGAQMKRTLKQAGASEEQIEQIGVLVEANQQAQQSKRRTLQNLQQQIRGELLENYNPDRDNIMRLIQQSAEIRVELTMSGIITQLEVRAVLGEEIWNKLIDKERALRRRRHRK